MNLREDALRIFHQALHAADASHAVHRALSREGSTLRVAQRVFQLSDYQRVRVLAIGKAAPPMARALLSVLGDAVDDALVVTRHGHANESIARALVMEAGHPVPDEAGERAA